MHLAPRSTPRPRAGGWAWPPDGACRHALPGCDGARRCRLRRRARRAAPSGRSGCCDARTVRRSRVPRASAPRPHDRAGRHGSRRCPYGCVPPPTRTAGGSCSTRRADRRPTDRRDGRPCRGRRPPRPPPRTTSPPSGPSVAWRTCPAVEAGAWPVSVSMPSTRTTHLSRCCRTIGRPVGFHAMVTSSDTSLIHGAKTPEGPAVRRDPRTVSDQLKC